MHKDWLTQKANLTEVVEKEKRYVPRLTASIPFGYAYPQWKEFISHFQDGDELWEFSSPMKNWQNLCGRAGYAIVRDSKVIESFVTMKN